MEKKHRNEYDETKELLQRIRKLNKSSKKEIQEQISSSKPRLGDDDMDKKQYPDVSNFGDPVEWQKSEREDRQIDTQPNEEPSNWEEPQKEPEPSNWKNPDETSSWDPLDKEGETNSMMKSIENWNSEESSKNKDYDVVNNVEVVINSTDTADLQLNDDEKVKLSQLIDDFRTEVSEITEFGQLNIYDDNAKLDGNLGEVNLGFTLSAGDDNGLFLSNSAMVQINDNIMEFINKLKLFQIKFNDVLNELISNRQQN